MSHGILENDTMFSVKERPWHNLGTVLTEAPTIEEGIKQAGLDWTVSLRPIVSDDTDRIQINTHKMVVREDLNQPLGIVGSDYKILQNREAFNFFDTFIENNLASLETAGSLFNGKKVFILAKINQQDMHISDEDIVEKYILLSNSHDGSQSVRVGYTPIRVVCNNTLSCAVSNRQSNLIKITHRTNVAETLEAVRETMNLINQDFLATEEQYKVLAQKGVSQDSLEKYVKQVFSVKKLENIINDYEKGLEEKEEIEEGRKRLLSRIEEIFELEPVHNAWTMYNSVNYYLNHDRGRTLENRYNSMWFGDSKRLDNRAFQIALAL